MKLYNYIILDLLLQMDTFVNPLKTGVRNVAHTVKNVPSNLVDGVTMVSDKMTDTMNDISKVVFSTPGKVSRSCYCNTYTSCARFGESFPQREVEFQIDQLFQYFHCNPFILYVYWCIQIDFITMHGPTSLSLRTKIQGYYRRIFVSSNVQRSSLNDVRML